MWARHETTANGSSKRMAQGGEWLDGTTTTWDKPQTSNSFRWRSLWDRGKTGMRLLLVTRATEAIVQRAAEAFFRE